MSPTYGAGFHSHKDHTVENIKYLFFSGKPIHPSSNRHEKNQCTYCKVLYKMMPYFFFVNAILCLAAFRSGFGVVIALIFTAWGATSLLFRYCHRCRDAFFKESSREST